MLRWSFDSSNFAPSTSYLTLGCIAVTPGAFCVRIQWNLRDREQTACYTRGWTRIRQNNSWQKETASVLDMAILTVVVVNSGAEERNSQKCQEKHKHFIASYGVFYLEVENFTWGCDDQQVSNQKNWFFCAPMNICILVLLSIVFPTKKSLLNWL